MGRLEKSFFQRSDVLEISMELIGKYLYCMRDGILCGGMIVETEAYMAPEDKASHAYNGKRTKRTENFYSDGGIAYVYLCYGIHSLFNIITNREDIPHAILIRAIEPKEGIETMLFRRKKDKLDFNLTSGPGTLCTAMGIDLRHNGTDLEGSQIWLGDKNIYIDRNQVICSPRVGVSYAEEYASKPWRFRLKDSPWTGKGK